ncbi:CASP9 [Mytilus coruscus]|uniref:CASP9 n=1 Tax=Mytilus coruscus TaxID=42192 RepID=A0A6J8CHD1_MYTCO|nr:CASP9 [Mytilus coruscus]
MSTNSSDSDDIEDTEFAEIDSSPDGIKLRKKILAVIKRIRINRKSGTRLGNGKIIKESQKVAEQNSTEDKKYQLCAPAPVLYSNDDIYKYHMSRRKPGLAVFIINSRFEHQPYRPFARTDCRYMVKLFKHLGFEIHLLEDLKGQELWRELIAIQRSITTEYDCFVCVISSHGAELPLSRLLDSQRKLREHVIYTRNGTIPTEEILKIFNDEGCKNLQGKPRMFFIQACRCVMGADEEFDVDRGVDIEVTQTRIHEKDYPVFHIKRRNEYNDNDTKDELKNEHCDLIVDEKLPTTSKQDTRGRPKDYDSKVSSTRFHSAEPASFCFIPCHEDFLVMFSSASERTAWSDNGKGGWLMYCLYKVFKGLLNSEFKTDLLHILVGVCDKMARVLAAGTPSDPLRNRTKSAATIYHMLTKDIYLQPKHAMKQSFCSRQFEEK